MAIAAKFAAKLQSAAGRSRPVSAETPTVGPSVTARAINFSAAFLADLAEAAYSVSDSRYCRWLCPADSILLKFILARRNRRNGGRGNLWRPILVMLNFVMPRNPCNDSHYSGHLVIERGRQYFGNEGGKHSGVFYR